MAGKRKQIEEEPMTHWRQLGGFSAFDPNAPPPKKRKAKRRWQNGETTTKRPKLVKCKELQEPEAGIHSLAWAQAIAPQTSSFFKLPIEIRNRIYEHVINDWTCGLGSEGCITPWRRGRKFYDKDWPKAREETAALYLLCRQAYVDVVGGGLLYTFRKFHFSSPTTMLNYLWVINPRHKDAIRTIQLDMKMGTYLECLDDAPPRKCGRPLEMIASCKNLQHFVLHLKMYLGQYSIERVGTFGARRSKSISITEGFLQLILNCTALRSIRRLKSFEMVFTPDWDYYWLKNTPIPPFEEKNQTRIIEVVDEIRSLVTKDPD